MTTRPDRPSLRETAPSEAAALCAIYPRTFPDEDLTGLVAALLRRDDTLSLAAFAGAAPVAHVIFTPCGEAARGALLAPLAVVPEWQGQGLGTALVQEGLARLARRGVAQVFVLGDPDFYGRAGFGTETRVTPPCPLPRDWAGAWQSRRLGEGPPLREGPLVLPDLWLQPSLWRRH